MKRQAVLTTIVFCAALVSWLAAGTAAVAQGEPFGASSAAEGVPPAMTEVSVPDCPGQSWRRVRLQCRHSAVGHASGVYGGTAFSLSCADPAAPRTTLEICTTHGDLSYEVSVEMESPAAAACVASGSAPSVHERCDCPEPDCKATIRLTIN